MILHIDCNTFFASCEIAADPSLEGKPVVVANVNEAGGGIILALNAEAKALGFRRGNPVFQVHRQLEALHVTLCPADHKKYRAISSHIMQAVQDQGLVVDFLQYSIDEFFGEMPIDDPDEARRYIRQIRDHIYSRTRIPVSCGYSQTYTLAKLATHFAKHYKGYEGICVLLPEHRRKALSLTPIEDIWGIGRQYRKKMVQIGVATAQDFVDLPREKVQRYFSTPGLHTWLELRGERAVQLSQRDLQTSISQSRTFGFMIAERGPLEQEIRGFVSACAGRLRSQGGLCSTVTVFVATNRHRDDLLQYSNGASIRLERPACDTPTLLKAALEAFSKVYRSGYQYKQAGVVLGDISRLDGHQTDLFEEESDEKWRRLSQISDQLNSKFGDGTIHFG